jgi:hypothetical protein
MSTRQRLSGPRKIQPLTLPSGVQVHVRGLSGFGRQRYVELAEDIKTDRNAKRVFLGSVAALCLCDEQGVLLYDVDNSEDVLELSDEDGEILTTINDALLVLSGLRAKDAEDGEKKSEASPSG